MTILTRAEILARNGLRREVVAVPEWGGEVIVQEFSAAQRDLFEAAVIEQGKGKKKTLANFRAKLAAASIVDEQGDLVFEVEDVELLGRQSARALQRVAEAAIRINALSTDEVEELAKN
jgi:hypothetical protein